MTDQVQFLTAEWAAALEAAANASPAFHDAARGVRLTIQQEVGGEDGAVVRYALAFDDGVLRVTWDGVPDPDVTFVQSRDTAERLSRGTLNAQQAFVLGKLRVRGNLDRLVVVRDAFVEMEDAFAEVRAQTAY